MTYPYDAEAPEHVRRLCGGDCDLCTVKHCDCVTEEEEEEEPDNELATGAAIEKLERLYRSQVTEEEWAARLAAFDAQAPAREELLDCVAGEEC